MAARFWVGGAGNWNDTARWSATSGGTSGASVPTSADSVTIDSNSGASAFDLTVNVTASCSTITINNTNCNLTLSANLTASGGVTFTIGTITLNSYTFSMTNIASNNSNSRTINFGTGNITLTAGAGATIWNAATVTGLSISGTPAVNVTGAPTTGTRTINFGSTAGASESNVLSFTISAGSDTIVVTTGSRVLDFVFTSGFTGTYSSSSVFYFYGNLTFNASHTFTAGAGTISYLGSGTKQITSAGLTIDAPFSVNGAGTLQVNGGDLTVGTTRKLTLSTGTLSFNGNNVSAGSFVASGSNAVTVAMGTSKTFTITGNDAGIGASVFNVTNANLSVTYTTGGTISLTSSSAKTFAGNGLTYPTLNQGGSGTLTVSGSNTFASMTSTYSSGGTGAATITFTAGTTQTCTTFTASGSSGKLLTLNSSSGGSAWTINSAASTNSVTYATISDSTANGPTRWYAFKESSYGSTNGGNNLGWVFSRAALRSGQFV